MTDESYICFKYRPYFLQELLLATLNNRFQADESIFDKPLFSIKQSWPNPLCLFVIKPKTQF